MVKTNKQQQQQQQQTQRQRPIAVTDRSSMNASGSYVDNTFCVVLHVVEAINFYGREMREGESDQIVMNAALNTVDFEVEGTPSVTTETIIFNSNCIWECDMAGIKRIKTDHRPVKVTFFACNNSGQRKTIGSLLLPVRGIPVLGLGGNNSAMQLKMFWHKLICISNEFRSHKPEVLLMLTIIKKSLLHTKEFKHLMVFNSAKEKEPRVPPLQSPGHSITANMLQSQANVYVQSLVQLGLLQVGNNPLVDCDIIEVVLQFKKLKNVNKFVKSVCHGKDANVLLLMFDFVGNVTNIELKLNDSDCYTLDDVLGLRFKSSLRSIRLYFQRIFYLPINMYINGTSIANYRMDFGKLMPSDKFFADRRKFTQTGSFAFERFGRMGSARELKPIMDYSFTVDIQEVCWRQKEKTAEAQMSQQPSQELQDDVSLHCAGSKAVIHEAPKDRVNESVGEYPKLVPGERSKPEIASIDSLNVGAELSGSDERESILESPLSNVHDSDAAEVEQKFHMRRKKFTRFLETEQVEGAEILDMPAEGESDAELLGIYNNSKFCPNTSTADDENVMLKTIQYSRRSLEQSSEIIELKSKESSARVISSNEAPAERKALKVTKTKNRNNYENIIDEVASSRKIGCKPSIHEDVDEVSVDDLFSQLEKDVDSMSQVTKDSSMESNSIPEVNKHKKLPMNRKQEIAGQSEVMTDKNSIESITVEPKVLLKKKVALKTEEFERLEAAERAKIVRKSESVSNAISQNRYLTSDESFLQAENENELICQRPKTPKKPRKRIVNEAAKDMDTTTDTETQEKPKARNSQVEPEVCGPAVFKKPQRPKKPAIPNADLCLSARWVEVTKDQAIALEETKKFIDETCRETNQFSESSRRSSRKKTDRLNAYLSSDVEDSSFIEEYLRDSKVERKVTNKSSISKYQKTSEVEIQARNQLKSRTKAEYVEKIHSAESELTDYEESKSMQSPATKSRRVAKKRSVQDSPELRHIYDATDWKQAEQRRSSRRAAAEACCSQDADSEQEAQKKPLRKKVTRVVAEQRKECNETTTKSIKTKSQMDLDAQVSRLEVTLRMSPAEKSVNQGIIPDASKMDESLKQILVASMELKDDMQLKALEYLRSLSQKKPEAPSQPVTVVNEASPGDAIYAVKFNELEQHIVVLEDHLRQFESRTLEMQKENSKLAQEKVHLKQRISSMEQQLVDLRQQTTNGNEIKQVLSEMQQQNMRYQDISKARDRYKKQWRRAAKHIHSLKLAMYEQTVEQQYQSSESNVLNLKSILTKDAEEFEREYGRFRKPNSAMSFSGSADSSEPLLKDYLRELSNQRRDKQKLPNPVDNTRMH